MVGIWVLRGSQKCWGTKGFLTEQGLGRKNELPEMWGFDLILADTVLV